MRVRRRQAERGFTLTELMAVVAIMGVLATIATTMFVGQSKASKTGEAMGVLQATRAAEERYRAENQLYFPVDSTVWYPSDGKGKARYAFKNPDNADYLPLWNKLSPTVDRPPVTWSGTSVPRGTSSVNGPGQQASARVAAERGRDDAQAPISA